MSCNSAEDHHEQRKGGVRSVRRRAQKVGSFADTPAGPEAQAREDQQQNEKKRVAEGQASYAVTGVEPSCLSLSAAALALTTYTPFSTRDACRTACHVPYLPLTRRAKRIEVLVFTRIPVLQRPRYMLVRPASTRAEVTHGTHVQALPGICSEAAKWIGVAVATCNDDRADAQWSVVSGSHCVEQNRAASAH